MAKNVGIEYHEGQEVGGLLIKKVNRAARKAETTYLTECLKCHREITRTHVSVRARELDKSWGCIKCQGGLNKKDGERKGSEVGGRPKKGPSIDVNMAMNWAPPPGGNGEQ